MASRQPEQEPAANSLLGVGERLGLNEFAGLAGEADSRKLVQELQLHKIELEMQNEELQRVQAELRDSRQQVDHRVLERIAELTRTIESLAGEVRQHGQAEVGLRAAYEESQAFRNRLQAENAQLRRELGR